MGQEVHIIPVGFDFERLSQPISKGNLSADRIRLLDGSEGSEDDNVRELARRMVERLEFTFDRMLGKDVEVDTISFGFENAYVEAYEMIISEVNAGNEVWVNISSMPRSVAFAFASAANSLVVDDPELREDIHTYYVSPEKYLVIDMIKELRDTHAVLEQHVDDETAEEIQEQFQSIGDLLEEIDSSGVTKGARKMNGGLHVEFPAVASGELREFEEQIIEFLRERPDPMSSTSALARELASKLDVEADDAFRSKVQYNVSKLEKKGYINRSETDNRYETQLSTMGRLWAQTHLQRQPLVN